MWDEYLLWNPLGLQLFIRSRETLSTIYFLTFEYILAIKTKSLNLQVMDDARNNYLVFCFILTSETVLGYSPARPGTPCAARLASN